MAFVAMQTVGVVMIPVVTPFLQERFSVSDAQVGLLTSAFALAVALTSIPMGLATARWGGRTLVAAAALFLAGSLVLAVAGSYEWLLAGRFIQGMGAGAGMPVGTALIMRLISPAWRHRAFGLFGAGTGVGTVATLLILPDHRRLRRLRRGVHRRRGVRRRSRRRRALAARAQVAAGVQGCAGRRRAAPLARARGRERARPAHRAHELHRRRRGGRHPHLDAGVLPRPVRRRASPWRRTSPPPSVCRRRSGTRSGPLAMKRWSKPAVLVVGLALTALATALVPAVAGRRSVAFIAVLITVLLAGAVLPPSLAVVGDVAHGHQAMGAATGLIGLFNVVGSMIAPWAFGALLDTYGTAPGDSGYTAGYLMLAGFCAVGALGAASSSSVVAPAGVRPWSAPASEPEAGMPCARLGPYTLWRIGTPAARRSTRVRRLARMPCVRVRRRHGGLPCDSGERTSGGWRRERLDPGRQDGAGRRPHAERHLQVPQPAGLHGAPAGDRGGRHHPAHRGPARGLPEQGPPGAVRRGGPPGEARGPGLRRVLAGPPGAARSTRLGTRDVQVVDELAPQDGEPVVQNWPFDIFRRTDVEQWLRDRGVETVVLVGVATGMAINIAAYQLADRLFSLIVPSDCVTDGNRAAARGDHERDHAGDQPRDDRGRRHRAPLTAGSSACGGAPPRAARQGSGVARDSDSATSRAGRSPGRSGS